jgi:predicted RNA-binding Zn-ribbon protein involved in translation (DUF1610 family)
MEKQTLSSELYKNPQTHSPTQVYNPPGNFPNPTGIPNGVPYDNSPYPNNPSYPPPPPPQANVAQGYPPQPYMPQGYTAQGYNNQYVQPVVVLNQPGLGIVVNNPGVFGVSSISYQCPNCKQRVNTITRQYMGCMVWLMFLLFYMVSPCVSCIPFFITSWYDTVHICPNCNRRLGSHSLI